MDALKYECDALYRGYQTRVAPANPARMCHKCGKPDLTAADAPKLWMKDGNLVGAVCGPCAVPAPVPVEEFR